MESSPAVAGAVWNQETNYPTPASATNLVFTKRSTALAEFFRVRVQ